MKSGFLTQLDAVLKDDSDRIWQIKSPLKYWSKLLNRLIVIPPWFETEETSNGDQPFFETDFASVPRLIIIYEFWGDRVHREAVLHDYLYRKDSNPVVSFMTANAIFREAMKSRGVSWYIRWPMYWGVVLGGYWSYHKLCVKSQLN